MTCDLAVRERGVVRNPSPILSSSLGVLYVVVSSFLPFSRLLDFCFFLLTTFFSGLDKFCFWK